ncbi:5392_t:CDS:2 [Rhizophagus irregularis]|nr:5392_t:CDS:2 [Rhizophagus irregularis]
MNKNFAVYLFLLGLIIYVHAADVMVNVGNAKGENVFEPAKILALPGDNVVFTWVSGKHSVIETDSLTACAKSEKPNAFTSDGAFMAPKTWTIPIPYDAAGGKTWFFCGVPGHCTPGTGGMAEATTISVNENQVHNDTNTYNHGQEVITIPENNDNNNLKDYITQIVRQELMQNQGK